MNLENESGITAVGQGHDICVSALIKVGDTVNHQDLPKRTALMIGAYEGHVKCVELLKWSVNMLIMAGDDVNMEKDKGETSLLYATDVGGIKC